MRSFVLILGWLFAWLIPPSAAAFPEQFSATYTLTAGSMTIGQAEWSLTSTGGGNYRYDAVTFPKGIVSLFHKSSRTEHSEWRYRRGRIQPLLYRYNRGGEKGRKVEVVFDWKRGIARNTANGETWRMSVPADVLDKNVYVLALMRDLGKGRRNFDYTIADGGRIKTYRFSFIGEESLDTKLGRVKTLSIKRLRKTVARETTFWCAPKFSYLPVKVVHREKDGTIITLRIDRFRVGPG